MKLTLAISAALLVVSVTIFAPSALASDHMSDAQAEVWGVVASSWEDETKETGAWPGEYLHADAHSWGADWPAPRDAGSIVNWARFGAEANETLTYELFPMNVTVSGDTAVVYYAAVQVTQNHEGKRERESTGLIETLARTDDGWKFLGLTSFEIGGDD